MLIGRPSDANSAKITTATAPAIAAGSARLRTHSSASTPPIAAPARTAACSISPIRRGMYSGTLPMPVLRSSAEAVWRVFVSDHSGLPVMSRSLPSQITGPAAASSVSRITAPRSRPARPAAAAQQPLRQQAQQVQPVEAREDPRLRAQQPGQREQRQHRPPGPRPARLDQQRAQHEHQIGDVDVGAHAVGDHRHARQEQDRGERAGSPPEPLRAEAVEHPPAGGQRDERQRHDDLDLRVRRERPQDHAEDLEQRVRGRRDRHAVGGRFALGELAAPGERVERVVVGEGDAVDQPQQDGAREDRGNGAEAARRGA